MAKVYNLLLFLFITLTALIRAQSSASYTPRRILYAGCYEDVVRPKGIWMTCANKKGPCEVRKENTHTLRVFFKPDKNSTRLVSQAAWNNGWFPIPLPNQDTDGCKFMHSSCPVTAGVMNSFTYRLKIENFWPANEYPVIWTLTDADNDEEILCFKFKINII